MKRPDQKNRACQCFVSLTSEHVYIPAPGYNQRTVLSLATNWDILQKEQGLSSEQL